MAGNAIVLICAKIKTICERWLLNFWSKKWSFWTLNAIIFTRKYQTERLSKIGTPKTQWIFLTLFWTCFKKLPFFWAWKLIFTFAGKWQNNPLRGSNCTKDAIIFTLKYLTSSSRKIGSLYCECTWQFSHFHKSAGLVQHTPTLTPNGGCLRKWLECPRCYHRQSQMILKLGFAQITVTNFAKFVTPIKISAISVWSASRQCSQITIDKLRTLERP